jgi:hypothetical protein
MNMKYIKTYLKQKMSDNNNDINLPENDPIDMGFV